MAKKRYKNAGKRVATDQASKIAFAVDKMDGLGQGVSKVDNKVTFIAKTLPGETGSARIFRRSKGVSFAKLDRLDESSPQRIEPECPHFEHCPGCNYLHTDYSAEMSFKQQALSDLLRKFDLPEPGIELISAPQRLHYRNRMQLHYRHKYIGVVDGLSDQVVEIPNCKIIRPELQNEFDALYTDKSWHQQHKGGGHVELYWRDGEVSVEWDKPYAHGGFTQVYDVMNQQLCDLVYQWLDINDIDGVLDLFSGKGNLTNAIAAQSGVERVKVDFSEAGDSDDFISLDLFDEDSLRSFQRRLKKASFNTMVIDPPRKGFPLIASWVKKYRPQQMAYVSCNASTLARDLHNLQEAGITFSIERILLMDLFPATYHYETVAFIRF